MNLFVIMDAADVEDLLEGLDDIPITNNEIKENNTEVDINTECKNCYKKLTELYSPRLSPGLQLPAELFLSCLNVLQNSPIDSTNQKHYISQLSSSTSKELALKIGLDIVNLGGAPLPESVWNEVCELSEELRALLHQIQEQSRDLEQMMPQLCPNLLAIVEDSTICAQLLLLPSSRSAPNNQSRLEKLSQTPPSNLISPVSSPLMKLAVISGVPPRLQKSALRILAGKLVLAARVDAMKKPVDTHGVDNSLETDNNSIGVKWRQEVERKIDKLLAPPPSVQQRALPKPTNKIKQRRGGQRIRKQKQKRAPSEVQQHNNMVKFGS